MAPPKKKKLPQENVKRGPLRHRAHKIWFPPIKKTKRIVLCSSCAKWQTRLQHSSLLLTYSHCTQRLLYDGGIIICTLLTILIITRPISAPGSASDRQRERGRERKERKVFPRRRRTQVITRFLRPQAKIQNKCHIEAKVNHRNCLHL